MKANERAATASVYQSIVALGSSINDLFIREPQMFCEMFEKEYTPGSLNILEDRFVNPKKQWVALKWLDYFETIFGLWHSIPEDLHVSWRAYIKHHLKHCSYLRRLVLDTDWYGEDLRRLCREIEAEQQEMGSPAGQSSPQASPSNFKA